MVLELISRVCAIGKAVHFHLHDGHPLVPGLADHFSFLTRFPVPFRGCGRLRATPAVRPGRTGGRAGSGRTKQRWRAGLIHPGDPSSGRPPAPGFGVGDLRPWRDLTNAERMNYWLGVLADNHLLATTLLGRLASTRVPESQLLH